VAGPRNKRVDARSTVEFVIAVPSIEQIVALAAVQIVVAVVADK